MLCGTVTLSGAALCRTRQPPSLPEENTQATGTPPRPYQPPVEHVKHGEDLEVGHADSAAAGAAAAILAVAVE
jgi:hypothetical protein